MGEPYKITIKHTPGAPHSWSYKVIKGGTRLDFGTHASRSEAVAAAERFADDHAQNLGGEYTYDYTPKLSKG